MMGLNAITLDVEMVHKKRTDNLGYFIIGCAVSVCRDLPIFTYI